MRIFRPASLTLAALLACQPAIAPCAWAKSSAHEELEATQKDLQRAKAQQEALSREMDALLEELKTLQDKLVKTASALQKTETQLSDAEEKIRILTAELKTKQEKLKQQQQRLSSLLVAEIRLSSTPPEAMIMMPQTPMEILEAAHALKLSSKSIHLEAQLLSQQLAELNTLKDKVTRHRDELAEMQAGIEKQRKQLMSQLSERTALQNKLGKRQKDQEEALRKLARKASDLQGLIAGIEEEEVRQQEREAKRNKPSPSVDAERLRSFASAKGRIRPPVSGSVVQSFGSQQGKNSTSKGVTLQTRKGAQVVSPYDSEVVFTGPFLTYGQMIILRHSDDFHTLLAGLTKIDVRVGQFLLEGEPIGAMGESDTTTNDDHKLYIELRQNNQPVNPAQWINGLKKK